MQRVGVAPVPGRQPGEARERVPLSKRIDGERIGAEVAAEHPREALEQAIGPWRAGNVVEARRLRARQREAHARMRHRQPLDRIRYGARLGAVAFQELEPRRRRPEQVAHLDPRAGWLRIGFHLALAAGVDGDGVPLRAGPRARRDRQQRDRGDRRQRLAAKAERADRRQVAVRQLRGGMALDGEREVAGVHAVAVVDDADQLSPARLDRYLDPPRAGIERVLDQLLDGRGRPLDHLAGGDAVDQHAVEELYGHAAGGLAESAPQPTRPVGRCRASGR